MPSGYDIRPEVTAAKVNNIGEIAAAGATCLLRVGNSINPTTKVIDEMRSELQR
ncbi:hypothetical protein KCP75_18470 [Salmonella enterica subsp. enterica]|nr:hypothetical protein KCP75_18470 [Salmonella enterica subsp. enterica]